MEMVNLLRLLIHRRLWVGLGAVAAAALGLAASGEVPAGPFASSQTRAAVASVQIQVDTPTPLLADLRASELTVATQTTMLAERLAGEDARLAMAIRVGAPELSVVSARTAIPGRSSPLSREAVAAAGAPRGAYRLHVSVATGVPVINVVASAPDRRTALRLAEAVPSTLDAVTKGGSWSRDRRVRIQPLAPPRAVETISGGRRPALGVAAAVLFFAGWCWLVLVADGAARAARRGIADPPVMHVRDVHAPHLGEEDPAARSMSPQLASK